MTRSELLGLMEKLFTGTNGSGCSDPECPQCQAARAEAAAHPKTAAEWGKYLREREPNAAKAVYLLAILDDRTHEFGPLPVNKVHLALSLCDPDGPASVPVQHDGRTILLDLIRPFYDPGTIWGRATEIALKAKGLPGLADAHYLVAAPPLPPPPVYRTDTVGQIKSKLQYAPGDLPVCVLAGDIDLNGPKQKHFPLGTVADVRRMFDQTDPGDLFYLVFDSEERAGTGVAVSVNMDIVQDVEDYCRRQPAAPRHAVWLSGIVSKLPPAHVTNKVRIPG